MKGLFPAAPWAPCDKELSLCFPQVCGEAPQKPQFFLSPCIQNRGQLGFIMITLEVVKIPKENFITDMELAAFFHKQCIGGMSCFGEEETFLEDKDDKGGSGESHGERVQEGLALPPPVYAWGLCLPSPGREERHWLLSQIRSSEKKETTGLKWSPLCQARVTKSKLKTNLIAVFISARNVVWIPVWNFLVSTNEGIYHVDPCSSSRRR